jgi:retron-type reverse transcriptase
MGDVLLQVAAFPNLLEAWHGLENRLPAAVRLPFAWRMEDRLLALADALRSGAYRPNPVPMGCHHPNSGKRIPVLWLEDRMVLRALKQVLSPRLERSFVCDTYAGLPGRGVHRAVARVMAFQRRVTPPSAPRSGWILKADVRSFYPSLRHDVLLSLCRRRLQDQALADLLARFLAIWGQWADTPGVGIPLGSAVSSLLSNLYLDPFDHWVKDELGFKCYVRYADDLAFPSAGREALNALLPRARPFLAERLTLALNERKTLLKHTGDGMDFWGYRLFYHPRLLRRKNMKKVRTRLARMARRHAQGALNQADVRKSLAGWLGYARFAGSYNFRWRLFADFRLSRNQEKK